MTEPWHVHVSVTAEDIQNGERGDCSRCPIALATMRATGMDVIAKHGVVSLVGDGWSDIRWRAYMPIPVESFVRNFDGDGIGSAFEFNLYFHRYSMWQTV